MEWIPFTLHKDHPKVLRLCELTGDDVYACIGRMAEWLRYIDRNCATARTGIGRGALHRIIGWQERAPIERETGRLDYFEAMQDESVAWIRVEDGLIVVGEFGKWFGKSSKRRHMENRRKAEYREKVKRTERRKRGANCPDDSAHDVPENALPQQQQQQHTDTHTQQHHHQGVGVVGVIGDSAAKGGRCLPPGPPGAGATAGTTDRRTPKRTRQQTIWVDRFIDTLNDAFRLESERRPLQRRAFAAVGWRIVTHPQREAVAHAVVLQARSHGASGRDRPIADWQQEVNDFLDREARAPTLAS